MYNNHITFILLLFQLKIHHFNFYIMNLLLFYATSYYIGLWCVRSTRFEIAYNLINEWYLFLVKHPTDKSNLIKKSHNYR